MEHSKCGSVNQSPINIVTGDAVPVPGTLIFEGYDIKNAAASRPVSITNNGHTGWSTIYIKPMAYWQIIVNKVSFELKIFQLLQALILSFWNLGSTFFNT